MNAGMRVNALNVLRVVHILEVFEEAGRLPARARRVPRPEHVDHVAAGRIASPTIDFARPAHWRRP